jgi:hypothetical protein
VKLDASFSSHGGAEVWSERGLFEWVTDIFVNPSIHVGKASGSVVRKHVEAELSRAGWALDCKINSAFDLTVTAKKTDLAFQVQTGNVSRAAYDLLKLQQLYITGQVEGACLAVPSHSAARTIGSNIANASRIWDEVQLFGRQITVPLLLIAFE